MLSFAETRPVQRPLPLVSPPPTLRLQDLPVHGQRLSLSLSPGAIVLVEGGSRAQRLRVLSIAAGLSHGGPGGCWLGGQSTRDGSIDERRQLRQRCVGRMLSVDSLPDGVSLRGAVAMPMLAAGLPPREAFDRASTVLQAFDLTHAAGRRGLQLSRRERRLALLARALVMSPPLLVLEDLDDGLAPHDLPRVRAALRVASAVEGCAVLFTTAEPRLAAMADQRVNMD